MDDRSGDVSSNTPDRVTFNKQTRNRWFALATVVSALDAAVFFGLHNKVAGITGAIAALASWAGGFIAEGQRVEAELIQQQKTS